jgi:ferredoxin-NADP reductase/DMSO/TMAO reductase YedYZ heme-binding membrane subunit
MNDPQIWWYITRASALIAWVLMTLSVIWGILLSTRIMRRIDNPGWLRDLHSYLGGMTLIMVALHMVTLMLDGYSQYTLVQVLVPYTKDYEPFAVALGILAFYILLAVQGSSLLIARMPRKFWKVVHYASYATLILVSLHAGWASSRDVDTLWYKVLAIVLISSATIAVVVRVLTRGRTGRAPTAKAWTHKSGTIPSVAPVAAGAPLLPATRTMVVASTSLAADAVMAIRLVPLGGGVLPIWYPGAHITLSLPNGLQRQYSLCGDPAERDHFDIAVLKTRHSEGGSEFIHANLTPGMTLEVSGPLNHFELEPASDYLFIAGGIGITPIKAMIESLPERRHWRLLYAGRSRTTMAFVDDLLERYPDRITVHARDEQAGDLDIASLVVDTEAQVYCCGPESLMSSVAAFVPAAQMHSERFVAVERVSDVAAQAIDVTCRKSKKEFVVGADQSILEAMEANGIPVLGSCRKGVCGTCEVRIVEGKPVHLDSVMPDEEKDSLRVMYPCVSRAEGTQLVLDI